MPKVVCGHCNIDMVPVKNGVEVIDMAYDPPEPYSIWCMDAWQCPHCKHVIILATPVQSPYMQHWQEGFKEVLGKIVHSTTRVSYYVYERYQKARAMGHNIPWLKVDEEFPPEASDDQDPD